MVPTTWPYVSMTVHYHWIDLCFARPCLVAGVKILKWNLFAFEVLNID